MGARLVSWCVGSLPRSVFFLETSLVLKINEDDLILIIDTYRSDNILVSCAKHWGVRKWISRRVKANWEGQRFRIQTWGGVIFFKFLTKDWKLVKSDLFQELKGMFKCLHQFCFKTVQEENLGALNKCNPNCQHADSVQSFGKNLGLRVGTNFAKRYS